MVCYAVILGNKPGERIGIVKYNESGYYPWNGNDYAPDDMATVKARVAEMNERIGIPADVCESMHHASVFGWHIPAANRAHEYYAAKTRPVETVLATELAQVDVKETEASHNFARGLECAMSILQSSEGDIDAMEFKLKKRIAEEYQRWITK